ncbi:uncharacterized protein [Amphiura filiformis]|uniref:uncharacterized protein isoform X2 n=1 Tax=Amphiura filiformis TaxID=82378 RepID=UPI003B211445
MDVESRKIVRPPQFELSPSVSSSSSPVPSPPLSPSEPDDHLNEEGEEFMKHRLLEQQEEIKGLKTEVKNLRRCIQGVHIIGRKLEKSQEELKRLKKTPLDDTIGQDEKTGCSDDDNDKTRVTEEIAKESDDKNNVLSSSEDSSDEEEEDVSEEEEEEDSAEEDSNTDEDANEFDGLEDNVESDEEEEEKSTTRVTKRKSKSRSKVKPVTKTSTKIQQLMSENSQLRAENSELQAAREAESANAFHYVTSTEANQLQAKADSNVNEKEESSVGMGTEVLEREKRCKDLEIENNELKATVKEIKKVNHKWDQFWTDKKGEYDAIKAELTTKLKEAGDEMSMLKAVIAQKDTEIGILKEQHEKEKKEHSVAIGKMERVLEGEADEKENIVKEKEDLLLTAKQRIDNAESENEELRREISEKQGKYEQAQKFARNLLKQKREMEAEIERLNGTLTEKVEEQSLLKSMDPKIMTTTTEIQLSVTEVNQQRSSPPLSPSCMLVMEEELFGEVPEKKVQVRHQRKPVVDQHPAPELSEEERSLTKAQLKEKVELFREQTEAYESDFRRERRDREAVVGKLDSVKKELRETKAMLHTGHKVYVHRVKDRPLHKDPLIHELPGYQRQATAAQRYIYPNKRDKLIAHGHHATSKSKEKERSQPKRHQREQRYHQHRYFEEYPEYDPEVFGDEDVQICRCPKHDCYVPVIQPVNNLSKPNGTC